MQSSTGDGAAKQFETCHPRSERQQSDLLLTSRRRCHTGQKQAATSYKNPSPRSWRQVEPLAARLHPSALKRNATGRVEQLEVT
eukprot:8597766-Pyramimonas_sp.AAC.1